LTRVSIVIRKKTATATYTTSPIALSMPCARSGSVGGPAWTCSEARLTARPAQDDEPQQADPDAERDERLADPVGGLDGVPCHAEQLAHDAREAGAGKRSSTRWESRSMVRSIRSASRAR
jgi:hypothetical protein